MKCPVCNASTLQSQELGQGLRAWVCPDCKGAWLSSIGYWDWLTMRQEADRTQLSAAEISLPIETEGRAKICPQCGHLLRRYKVWPNVRFYLDRCGNCQGVWFDAGEWAYLASRGEHDRILEFFGELWQEELLEAEARERLDALYRQRFGEEDYDKVRELRQWLWDHPQQGALIAFLTDKDPYRT